MKIKTCQLILYTKQRVELSTVLYCTVLYCTVLYCTVLYYKGLLAGMFTLKALFTQ